MERIFFSPSSPFWSFSGSFFLFFVLFRHDSFEEIKEGSGRGGGESGSRSALFDLGQNRERHKGKCFADIIFAWNNLGEKSVL